VTSAKPNHRRALELLASCRDGCTEAIMLAHGFTIEQMVELVRAGLATAKAERVVAGRRKMEVARVRITDAGLRANEKETANISAPDRRWPKAHIILRQGAWVVRDSKRPRLVK
jgi:hypothetical protein